MEDIKAMDIEALIGAARDARDHAYAPYSAFRVGAAVLTRAGRVITGCNVENASYGLTICAERAALFAAVAQGCACGDFTHLAVVGDVDAPLPPCGACRQVMLELGGPRLIVIQSNLLGAALQTTAAALLPGDFNQVVFTNK
jgi:cytidine deaminase